MANMLMVMRKKTAAHGNCKNAPKFSDIHFPIPEFSHTMHILLIGIISAACFAINADGDFVFDDSEAVVNNADVLPATPWTDIFHNDFWGTKLTNKASHKSYRPLAVLSFRLNYVLAGGLYPWGFRATNIVLHSVASMLTYTLYHSILEYSAPRLSFLCAVLFAVHPCHTEAVAAVVGRADLLCGIFFILSILVYIWSFKFSKQPMVLCVCSVLLAGIAMLCKEQGITVIGVCVIYEFVTQRRSVRMHCLIFLILSGIGLLAFRWWIMNSAPPVFQRVDNPASFADSWLTRVLTYNYIYALNAWVLLCPIWLCFDWSMGCVPLIESLLDQRCTAVVLFYAIVIAIATSAFLVNTVESRMMAIALSLLVCPFLPASNLFFRVGFVLAERALYLPSLGYCLMIGIGMRKLTKYNCNVIAALMFILVFVFSTRTVLRSLEWKTERTLFESALSVCPMNAKVHYNVGKSKADDGLKQEAQVHYREALRLNPAYDQAMNNLANLLKDESNTEEAEKLLRLAVHIRPDFAAAWMNLGIVLSHQKRYSEAEECYNIALQHRIKYPDCYYNLGNLYLEQKQYDKAYEAWTAATDMKPKHTVAWNNLVIMLDSLGKLPEAEAIAHKGLIHLPEEPSLHFHLANVLGKSNHFEAAEKHFLVAINGSPYNAMYRANLGVLYHRWKKFAEAKIAYEYALQLSPGLSSARDNLQLLLKTTAKNQKVKK